jgi:hypothetical protein
MSALKINCEKPSNLKGRPEDCSPKQIRKCHGKNETHPCTPDKETK